MWLNLSVAGRPRVSAHKVKPCRLLFFFWHLTTFDSCTVPSWCPSMSAVRMYSFTCCPTTAVYVENRHDNDMVKSRVQCATQYQGHPPKRVSGSGGCGSGRGEQTRSGNGTTARQSSPSADAVQVSRWSTSGEALSNSSSSPSGVGSATTQDRAIFTSSESHHNTKGLHANNSQPRGQDGDRAANEANHAIMFRSTSLGSSHSQARAQTVSSLRRSSSNTSEAFGHGGGGYSSSGGTNSAAASVAVSNDPDVLKVEIQRLQAALMNEFKGGNRFIGGAQFKSSNNSSRGGHGAVGGNSCGGCLQVCVRYVCSSPLLVFT